MAYTVIQHRRANSGEWTNANPVLAQGEIGIELDTNAAKVGDGITPWTSLPYFGSGGGDVNSVNGKTGDVILNAADVGAMPAGSGSYVTSDDVTNIDVVTQAEYDALGTKDPATLYVIQG